MAATILSSLRVLFLPGVLVIVACLLRKCFTETQGTMSILRDPGPGRAGLIIAAYRKSPGDFTDIPCSGKIIPASAHFFITDYALPDISTPVVMQVK